MPPAAPRPVEPSSPRALRALLLVALFLSGCQAGPSSFDNEVAGEAIFSDETRALERQMAAEAAALGATQSAVSMAAAWDPTGIASLALMPAGLAARNAMLERQDRLMDAQLQRDEEAFLRRWGMNPDGTPTGIRPPGAD